MKAVFADAPILFFAVVIGVALTFRVAVGAVRDAAEPEPVAPTFATTTAIVTGPEPGLPSGTGSVTGSATTSAAEVGAAARVQPIGSLPRPRDHGRRSIRGGNH